MKLTKIEKPAPIVVPLEAGWVGQILLIPIAPRLAILEISGLTPTTEVPGDTHIATLPAGWNVTPRWNTDISRTTSLTSLYRIWLSGRNLRGFKLSTTGSAVPWPTTEVAAGLVLLPTS